MLFLKNAYNIFEILPLQEKYNKTTIALTNKGGVVIIKLT